MLSDLANQSVVQCTPGSWMNSTVSLLSTNPVSKFIRSDPHLSLGRNSEPLTRLENRSMQPQGFTKDSNIIQSSSITQCSSPAWSESKINVSEVTREWFWQGWDGIRLCHLKCKIIFAFNALTPGEAPVFPVSKSLTWHSIWGRVLCPGLSRLQPSHRSNQKVWKQRAAKCLGTSHDPNRTLRQAARHPDCPWWMFLWPCLEKFLIILLIRKL